MGVFSRVSAWGIPYRHGGNDRGNVSLASRLALLGVVAALVAPPAPAKADFLDDIFGPSSPPPQAPAVAPRAKQHESSRGGQSVKGGLHFMPAAKSVARPSEKRKIQTASVSGEASSGATVAAAFCEAKNEAKDGASDIVMYDKTLRPGDAVVTLSGVQVFRGGGCPHKSTDFIALSGAGLARSKKNTLLAIESVMRRAEKD